jgi:putative DNA primase/helicase
MVLSPKQVAQILGGEASGNSVLAPGPGHGPKDRSLSILISWQAPDGFVVHSHAGDDAMACKDHVKRKLGMPVGRRAEQSARPPIAPAAVCRGDDQTRSDKLRRAKTLWAEGVDPRGTIVEHYLASRKLELPAELAVTALRYHPELPWLDGDKIIRVPAMIAAMRNIRSDEITGVHRTRLNAAGEKIGRKMLGIADGAVIKLDADAEVTLGLTIGEGVETTMAARQLGFRPGWAGGTVGSIKRFPVVSGIESLTILRENDRNGASECETEECAARWHAAGREVILVTPNIGKDVNDAIREG